MTAPTVKAMTDGSVYGVAVSDIQTDVELGESSILDGSFTGTLKFLSGSNPITDVWGEGNFLAVTFEADDWTAYTSVKVGLENSQGTGLVELIGHLDDLDSVFKIADKGNQKFKIVATDGVSTVTKTYFLSELVCLDS